MIGFCSNTASSALFTNEARVSFGFANVTPRLIVICFTVTKQISSIFFRIDSANSTAVFSSASGII